MNTAFKYIEVPNKGEIIKLSNNNSPKMCNYPIIPFIEGDGIGPDICRTSLKVLDNAVKKAYKGKRQIQWMEIFAGEKSLNVYGKDQWLPEETLHAIRKFKIAIKGPLTTPVGIGLRSLNVALRKKLDLYEARLILEKSKG